MNQEGRGHWGSRLGFILAAAGSAIGLGNIWKFPYITYENGGGLFVLVYLVCIALVGLPIMVAEIMIGRASQKNPVDAFSELSGEETKWTLVGVMGLATGFIILSFYSVVAGWAMNYTLMALNNSLAGKSAGQLDQIFGILYSSGSINMFWHTLFMALTVGIVAGGVQKGIEKWTNILMPALFILMFVLLLNSMQLDTFGAGMKWLFNSGKPLQPSSILEALGHSFFTLSIGMGAMLVYGSYMDSNSNIVSSSLWITFLDTLIALIACMIIFPVMVNEKAMSKSVGLVFVSLPSHFMEMKGGLLICAMFFLLLTFAALTSAISLLEVVVSYLVDQKIFNRKKSAIFTGLAIYFFGIPSALSGSGWLFADWTKIFGGDFFSCMDNLTTNWMLPFGGLLIAIYVGFFMNPETRKREFFAGSQTPPWAYTFWLAILRYVAPALIILVLLNKIDIIKTSWINEKFGTTQTLSEKSTPSEKNLAGEGKKKE